jgi:hypothetical protein
MLSLRFDQEKIQVLKLGLTQNIEESIIRK